MIIPFNSFINSQAEPKGFARGVGCTTSCVAELWALCDGLNLASSLGIESLIIQIDALAIVHLLNNSAANLAFGTTFI